MIVTARWLRVAALLGSLLPGSGLVSAAVRADQQVGVDSGVNPDATGVPPGALPRRLVLGQNIFFNERITTAATGQTQVLFVDQSTLSIGPNANMVIDQFVYDPNTGTGKMVASLTRGVFRFVGGKLSEKDNLVSFHTPAATIGIRGGTFLARVGENCGGAPNCNSLYVQHVYGTTFVTATNGASVTLTRPDFMTVIGRPGEAPSAPAPAAPDAAAAILAQLDGRAGSHGGAPIVPTDVMIVNSGLPSVVSANLAASIEAEERALLVQPQPRNVSALVAQTQLNNQNVQVAGAAATSVSGGTSVSFNQFLSNPTQPGTPTARTATTPASALPVVAALTPPLARPTSPSIATNPALPTINPRLPVVTNPVPPVTHPASPIATNPVPPIIIPPPVITPPPPPIITPPPPVIVPPAINATVAGASVRNGALSAYANGKIVNGIFTGAGYNFPLTLRTSGTSPQGKVTGTTYVASDGSFFYANLTPVDRPSQREFIYGGTPVNAAFYQATSATPTYLAFNIRPDAALQSSIPFTAITSRALASAATVSPIILATPLNTTFSSGIGGTKALQASLAVVGSGPGQSSLLVVMVGNVFDASLNNTSPAQPILNGIIHGSYLANAYGQPTRIYAPYVTPADANGSSFYGAKSISGFVVSNGNCCAPGELASPAYQTNTANQAVATYQFAQPATSATRLPAGVADATQTTRQLTGYFGGIMTKEPSPGSTATPIPYALAGAATINTNATNLQVSANLAGSDPFAATSGSGIKSVNLGYGSTLTGSTNARIAFINDKLFAAMENPSNPSTVNGVTVPVNDSNTGSNIYLVTQTAAPPPTTLVASTGLCSTCRYLQWGYWGGELDTPASESNPARTDVGHINFWVAGTPATSLAEISNLRAANFTGSYSGNLIGTVVNNGAQYLASGGLQATYAFGTQRGTFTVSHYDVLPTFTATGRAPLNGSNYSFTFNQRGIAGSVNGGFYGPKASETAGNYAFTAGPKYITSGIFAAGPPSH